MTALLSRLGLNSSLTNQGFESCTVHSARTFDDVLTDSSSRLAGRSSPDSGGTARRMPGRGAASRHALGTSVFGGMLVATICGVLVTPSFYVAFQKLENRIKGKKEVEEVKK